MTEQYGQYDDYDGDENEDGQQPNRAQQQRSNDEWATLRKEKKRASKAEQERDEARRQLAFMQAGIDPGDERTGYFVRGYLGEMSPAAIRQAALNAGFIDAPANGPSPEQQQQLGTQQRISGVAAGGTPVELGVAAQQQALNEAYTQGGAGAVVAKLVELGVPIQAD